MKATPRGRLIDIGGRRLHVVERGEGEPLVVLEAGLAASSLSWCLVERGIAEFARVVSYDRAGFGSSDEAGHAATAVDSAEDLTKLLDAMGYAGPIVLVGHSFGGLIARVFEQRHGVRVAGLVLVDPVVRAEWRAPSEQQAKLLARGVRLSRRGWMLARTGIVGVVLRLMVRGSRAVPKLMARTAAGKAAAVTERLAGEIRKMPRELWPLAAAHWSEPKSFLAMAKTLAGLTASANQLDETRGLGNLPLVVLSAEASSSATAALATDEHWREARLSLRGEHRIVSGSGHWMHFDAPEIVVEAVRRVVEAVWADDKNKTAGLATGG